ncbi:MAG: type II toxin-antitoxin system RelE/ParE family toxin [Tissierellia bacterium]|jgi:mRNA interferase RelE/StbE|nr:type II toxin-antitoxin system RelE/ParE family toxin [Tissierellia bacterium]
MTKIAYSKDAKKTLDSYEKKTAKRITEAIDRIPMGDIKRLVGSKVPPLFRIRVGKYRAIYFYSNNNCLNVVKIDTRGDIYK